MSTPNTQPALHSPFVEACEPLFPRNATVIDLGAGDGRNGLFLARKGHNVKNVDVNDADLEVSKQTALALGGLVLGMLVNIEANFNDEDFINSLPSNGFDVVMSTISLQYINKSKRLRILDNFRRLTKPGGFNLIKAYIGDAEQQQAKSKYNLYFPGEIRDHYVSSKWAVLKYEEELKKFSNVIYEGEVRTEVQSVTDLLAQKPVSESSLRARNRQTMDAHFWQRNDPEYYEGQMELQGQISTP